MNVDRNLKICDVPIIKIRDFLKVFHNSNLSLVNYISHHFNLTLENSEIFLKELINEGYIEMTESKNYNCTVKGNALANTRFFKRLNKEKADRAFEAFMERVKVINEDNSYAYKVKRLVLFGSYLTKNQKDFGDIDIAYELEKRLKDTKDHQELEQRIIKEAKEEGKVFRSFLDEILYPKNLVLKFLKRRYISLHSMEEIEELSASHKQIFP